MSSNKESTISKSWEYFTEKDRENTWKLVQDFSKSSINVGLYNRKTVAEHRIPGINQKTSTQHRQSWQFEHKKRYMRKKDRDQRWNGLKLVYNVTGPNTELITALLKHHGTNSEWCVIGFVFGKLNSNTSPEIRHTL